jgi:hypothetical protein
MLWEEAESNAGSLAGAGKFEEAAAEPTNTERMGSLVASAEAGWNIQQPKLADNWVLWVERNTPPPEARRLRAIPYNYRMYRLNLEIGRKELLQEWFTQTHSLWLLLNSRGMVVAGIVPDEPLFFAAEGGPTILRQGLRISEDSSMFDDGFVATYTPRVGSGKYTRVFVPFRDGRPDEEGAVYLAPVGTYLDVDIHGPVFKHGGSLIWEGEHRGDVFKQEPRKIYRFDLPTGQKSVLMELPAETSPSLISVSGDWLLYTAGQSLCAHNLVTGENLSWDVGEEILHVGKQRVYVLVKATQYPFLYSLDVSTGRMRNLGLRWGKEGEEPPPFRTFMGWVPTFDGDRLLVTDGKELRLYNLLELEGKFDEKAFWSGPEMESELVRLETDLRIETDERKRYSILGEIRSKTGLAGVALLADVLINDPSSYVRISAAGALRTLARPEAVPALIHALTTDAGPTPGIAAEALAKIGTPEAIQAVVACLTEENLRFVAAQALGEWGGPEVLEPLDSALALETKEKVQQEIRLAIEKVRVREQAKRIFVPSQEDKPAGD